jgi:glutamyl-tRNA synthetase
MTQSKKVITRFPPSPTGEIHIGNMRTMLFNYLYAKHFGGEVFLRFEDTDRERSNEKYESVVIDGLHALGLVFDHGPFRQSERTEVYKKKLRELIGSGKAYEGEESSDGSGNKVVRFKNPNKTITFQDKIRGAVSIDSTIFGDFVLARNINSPIYHLAVVVDDMEMGVTHIIRGEDHITSTPRQILLLEALGGEIPEYAHLPLIVGEDKKKLSKRHGAVSVGEFLRQGYLPGAIVNYLAFLGWNPGGEREIYTIGELIQEFSLEKVGKSAARFNYDKLNSINKQYLSKLSDQEYNQSLQPFLGENAVRFFVESPKVATKLVSGVIRTRLNKFSDIQEMEEKEELEYFFKRPIIERGFARFKDDSDEKTKLVLLETKTALKKVSENEWGPETVKNALAEMIAVYGNGSVLHSLRTVLSGKKQSPDPFTISSVLGKEETISRVEDYLLHE